jgi:hypothetical protein
MKLGEPQGGLSGRCRENVRVLTQARIERLRIRPARSLATKRTELSITSL